MKIELLKTFLEVSRTLHFRHASENLFITQSAVSARIKLLEEDLGVLLFDRSQKQLNLTPEGNRLTKHAKELIFMWDKAKQEVALVDDNIEVLSIGSMSSIWDIVLQNWLNKISKNIDEIGFITKTYNQSDLKKCVLNGLLDVAFSFEAPIEDDIITEKVTAVPLHLVSSEKASKQNYKDMHNFIKVDYGSSINLQYQREFKDAAPAKHIINQPRIALGFILENGGSAYLPRQLAIKHINNKSLYLVEQAPVFSREIHAMYLEKSYKQDVIQQALHYFPEIIFN